MAFTARRCDWTGIGLSSAAPDSLTVVPLGRHTMQTPHALMLLLVCIATGGEAFVALVPSIHRSRSPSCGSLHGVPIVPITISTASSAARRATQPLAAISLDTKAATSKPTAVYALIMTTFITFFVDNILRLPQCKSLYLYHSRWAWWQPLTAVFCHGSRAHLSGNAIVRSQPEARAARSAAILYQ